MNLRLNHADRDLQNRVIQRRGNLADSAAVAQLLAGNIVDDRAHLVAVGFCVRRAVIVKIEFLAGGHDHVVEPLHALHDVVQPANLRLRGLLRVVIRREHGDQVARLRLVPRVHHFQLQLARRADAPSDAIIRQGDGQILLHGADGHHRALGHRAQAFARLAVHDLSVFRRHRRVGIEDDARHIRPVGIISPEIPQMAAQHIAVRVALLHARPLVIELHHIDGFVFVNRADQLGVLVLFLADGQIHVRRRAVHRREAGRNLIILRQLNAVVCGAKVVDPVGQHIALHALLHHGKPFLAQLGDVHRFALFELLQLLRGFAFLRADGQAPLGHAQILRGRRQILDVSGQHIAHHAVLVNLRPLAAIFDDVNQLARLHAAQLRGRRGFLRAYGHGL